MTDRPSWFSRTTHDSLSWTLGIFSVLAVVMVVIMFKIVLAERHDAAERIVSWLVGGSIGLVLAELALAKWASVLLQKRLIEHAMNDSEVESEFLRLAQAKGGRIELVDGGVKITLRPKRIRKSEPEPEPSH